jgi:hypothetical protein
MKVFIFFLLFATKRPFHLVQIPLITHLTIYVQPGILSARIIPPPLMVAPPTPEQSMIGDEYGIQHIACLPARG